LKRSVIELNSFVCIEAYCDLFDLQSLILTIYFGFLFQPLLYWGLCKYGLVAAVLLNFITQFKQLTASEKYPVILEFCKIKICY
jgi:hypothetical protein